MSNRKSERIQGSNAYSVLVIFMSVIFSAHLIEDLSHSILHNKSIENRLSGVWFLVTCILQADKNLACTNTKHRRRQNSLQQVTSLTRAPIWSGDTHRTSALSWYINDQKRHCSCRRLASYRNRLTCRYVSLFCVVVNAPHTNRLR